MTMSLVLAAAVLVASLGVSRTPPPLPTVRAAIVLRLRAAPDRALPMFDPVNESRWSPDWHPTLIGDGRVASGLVFTTGDGQDRGVWLLDRYDSRTHEIRYVVFHASTLTTIDIAVVSDGAAASTATVAYTRTALDAGAVESVLTFARHFPTQGPHWESAINAALDAKPAP